MNQCIKDAFDIADAITDITCNSRRVKVTSRINACPTDKEDNKLVNLAHDSNCHIIITRNKSDFMYAQEKGIKTQKGEVIQYYEPELFLKCFEYMKRNSG